MTSSQANFPIAPSKFKFAQHGQSGAWISELLPHTAKIADDLCFIKSMHTEAINHDPAITFMQTGAQLAGRPSLGAWMSYGLGSENTDLPAFVAMISGSGDQPLYDRLWGSGFLPTRYAGVKFRSQGDPVLFLSNPPGINRLLRRGLLDDLSAMNELQLQETGDPEITTRIAQYEMAYRMQTSVPELTDISDEPAATFELYGEAARKPGTFAWNCLLARRLSERGVRFVEVSLGGWDTHAQQGNGTGQLANRLDDFAKGLAAFYVDMGDAMLWPDLSRNYTSLIADDLWGGSGVTAADVDIAEIYDCFTTSALLGIEGLGLAPRGGGGDLIRSGVTRPGGSKPINTNGGLLSEGYLHGMNTVAEAVLQLQGRCGERTVAGAETCVVTSGALTDGSGLVLARG